ncbi:MAG: aminotransferase class I/II-fold pyridoxal phosphate-dependent enzyme, partial [Pseudomonas sp.]|nr:aminotransferase class I/II-fold pyridoxal phosphate-dependent enzyme [Pseudomonas sp.]
MLEHGGRLRLAAQRHGIPLSDWLDLSTGVAPYHPDLPTITSDAWARLPEPDDGLDAAAQQYYGARAVLPVAGSQSAIQALPRLRGPARVGIVSPCYAEHAKAWRRAGHRVVELCEASVPRALDQLDVLLVVNPNNPTGQLIAAQRLLQWRSALATYGGWLVVDEAFMDCTPEHSLAAHSHLPGLVVLR